MKSARNPLNHLPRKGSKIFAMYYKIASIFVLKEVLKNWRGEQYPRCHPWLPFITHLPIVLAQPENLTPDQIAIPFFSENCYAPNDLAQVIHREIKRKESDPGTPSYAPYSPVQKDWSSFRVTNVDNATGRAVDPRGLRGWALDRLRDVQGEINNRTLKGVQVPLEWIQEYNDLISGLKAFEKKDVSEGKV